MGGCEKVLVQKSGYFARAAPANVKDIVAQMEAEGKSVPRDAFGHVKLDAINPGKYFADTFSALLGCEKVLVQKSGYFARAAPANAEDLELINKSCVVAVEMACLRVPGVVGMDENKDNELRCCEFTRIKGGKHFNIKEAWYTEMMASSANRLYRPENAARRWRAVCARHAGGRCD